MNKKELVESAIAKMSERREEERREEEERRRIDSDRNAEELKRIIGVHPYIADYDPEATPTGIWIMLPECFPIIVSGWGGRLEVLTFGVSMSSAADGRAAKYSKTIEEAIERAHDAFNGN